MVRGNVLICVGQGCGQLSALLSQLQPAHNLPPREVSERPQDGMVALVSVLGKLYLGHGAYSVDWTPVG